MMQFPSVVAVSVPWWGYFGRLTHHGGSPTLLFFDTVPEQSEIVLETRGALTSFDSSRDAVFQGNRHASHNRPSWCGETTPNRSTMLAL